MACSKQVLSFAVIIRGRDSNVRITQDGLFDVMDTVMVVTSKSCNNGNETLRNLEPSLFDKTRFVMRKGRRYATSEDIIALIMVLPGKTAKLVRSQFKDIIVRYLDGDRSMCCEIEANQAMGKAKSYAKFASKVMSCLDEDKDLKAGVMPPTFYVYATKSPAFPGLIKIGKTVDVANRLSSLNTSCKPAPHAIVAVAQSFDNDRDEIAAHAFFSSVRREGEFFQVEDSEVLAYFAAHITTRYNAELTQNIARLQGLSV